ncbi:hypothetical protein LCGC14_0110840 [marine sediment metagenome]|uniref:Uncharacterized protein n=1 Tax=marine sediment metagenome TaxID=412755 RepID=A0A0F9VPD6_9ZZZZ
MRRSRHLQSHMTAQSGTWPSNKHAAVQPVEAAIRTMRSIFIVQMSVCGQSNNYLPNRHTSNLLQLSKWRDELRGRIYSDDGEVTIEKNASVTRKFR